MTFDELAKNCPPPWFVRFAKISEVPWPMLEVEVPFQGPAINVKLWGVGAGVPFD